MQIAALIGILIDKVLSPMLLEYKAWKASNPNMVDAEADAKLSVSLDKLDGHIAELRAVST
jgi:hypothetical protein